jgi:hypothetical protein
VPRAGSARDEGGGDRESHWFPYSAAKLKALELALVTSAEADLQ